MAIHKFDSVPGISGPCYPAHIDKGPGQDPRIAQLQAEVATLQKSPQNQPQTPVVTINVSQALSSLQAMKTALQSMETSVQTVINDLEPS